MHSLRGVAVNTQRTTVRNVDAARVGTSLHKNLGRLRRAAERLDRGRDGAELACSRALRDHERTRRGGGAADGRALLAGTPESVALQAQADQRLISRTDAQALTVILAFLIEPAVPPLVESMLQSQVPVQEDDP